MSFLDQKFNDPAATGKGTELPVHQEPLDVSAPPARSASLDPAPDFSVFGSDRTHKPLPPFIPANEPSYSSLVSQRTTDALLSSLRQLTEATRPPEPVAAPQEKTLAPRLDEFMADVLRPLLSSWLDTNLERIVDQAVRDEIAKVTKKIRP